MTFLSDVMRFDLSLKARRQALFVNVVAATKASITDGSAETGAPGQPVDTGNLKNSWQAEFISPDLARISTNVEYARTVEENVRGVTFKNHGPHSCSQTVANFDRIVISEAKKLGET